MAEEHTDGKTVLIAVDSSDLSKDAFLWYVRHLHKPGNKLVCVHALEAPNLTEEAWDITSGGKGRASALKYRWEQVQEDSKRLTNQFHKLLSEHHLKAQLQLLEGVPGDAIVKSAKLNKADYVIIGSRGQGKFRRTVLGSVSDFVLHHAHCPVCIVHDKSWHTAK